MASELDAFATLLESVRKGFGYGVVPVSVFRNDELKGPCRGSHLELPARMTFSNPAWCGAFRHETRGDFGEAYQSNCLERRQL